MALIRRRNWDKIFSGMVLSNVASNELGSRWYGSVTKMDWPRIQRKIERKARGYPIKAMIPVAEEVLQARSTLIRGVTALLKVLPVVTCKHCPELHIGEAGHLIRTCCGYKRVNKRQLHTWTNASLNDILVPVETFHLGDIAQDVIKHHQRFDIDRVPAVVELCYQAGASPLESDFQSSNSISDSIVESAFSETEVLSTDDLRAIGNRTVKAWETLREGVQKLLLVYYAKVCKYCSEVHVGPFGHNARSCGVFKYENWRGKHFWERASVDDLVPPKIVWCRRPQDPPVLLDEGRNYYGHAPAVVDLCWKAGVVPPLKYCCMMKYQGLKGPPSDIVSG